MVCRYLAIIVYMFDAKDIDSSCRLGARFNKSINAAFTAQYSFHSNCFKWGKVCAFVLHSPPSTCSVSRRGLLLRVHIILSERSWDQSQIKYAVRLRQYCATKAHWVAALLFPLCWFQLVRSRIRLKRQLLKFQIMVYEGWRGWAHCLLMRSGRPENINCLVSVLGNRSLALEALSFCGGLKRRVIIEGWRCLCSCLDIPPCASGLV